MKSKEILHSSTSRASFCRNLIERRLKDPYAACCCVFLRATPLPRDPRRDFLSSALGTASGS